jgi:hypothetical protein
LDSFEKDLEENTGAGHEQEDYARKAQASELTLVGWSRKGIGNIYFMRHQFDPLDLTNTLQDARTWYARADAFLEGEDDEGAVTQRQTVRKNGLQLELFVATRLLHKEFACAASSKRPTTTAASARW